ncbi:hypothetical protein Y888_09365 [Mixta calida B021323]|nr:hypothetical protein Y888_09365 [Mixta calida B021323]
MRCQKKAVCRARVGSAARGMRAFQTFSFGAAAFHR